VIVIELVNSARFKAAAERAVRTATTSPTSPTSTIAAGLAVRAIEVGRSCGLRTPELRNLFGACLSIYAASEYREGCFGRAFVAYEDAVEFAGSVDVLCRAHTNAGAAAFEYGRFRQSLTHSDAAIALAETDTGFLEAVDMFVSARCNRALALIELDRAPEAVEATRAEFDPDWPSPTDMLRATHAYALWKAGQPIEASEAFTDLELRQSQMDADALRRLYQYRAAASLGIGKFDFALLNLAQMDSVGGVSPFSLATLAEVYFRSGRYDAAVDTVGWLERSYPDSFQVEKMRKLQKEAAASKSTRA